MNCANLACGRPARRKWCSESCRQRCRQDSSAQRNRKGLRADGTKRPSRERNDKGLRADGTKRPSRERNDRGLLADGTKRLSRKRHDAKRGERGGTHSHQERMHRPFVGVGTTDDGVLLIGDRAIVCVGWRTTLAALFGPAGVPDDCEAVAFGLDRMVALWLREAPLEPLRELLDREGRTDPENPAKVRPVRLGAYAVDWLPGHFLWLRSPSGRSLRVGETAKFFGRTLADACAVMGVEAGGRPEGIVLAECMTRFREGCAGVGVIPRRWEGPGQAASTLLLRWSIKEHLSGWREK